MKKTVYVVVAALLLLTGCAGFSGKSGESISVRNQEIAEVPVYERTTAVFSLAEDANPYMTAYTENGFYYFLMEAEGYRFFYQAYDGGDAMPFCMVTDGYVRDFAAAASEGETHLFVLRIGEEAEILEYDASGGFCGKVVLDEVFNSLEVFPKLLVRADGGYLISMEQTIYLLDREGKQEGELDSGGVVKKLFDAETMVYAVVEKSGENAQYLTVLKMPECRMEEVRRLPDACQEVFAFADGFLFLMQEGCFFWRTEQSEEEKLLDPDLQGLLVSQIRFVFGDRENVSLVSMEQTDQVREAYLFRLTKEKKAAGKETASAAEQELYTADGRKIVRVAIPEDYPYQMEYHVKKYNMISDEAFVELERFQGSLADFLGKGNRPDVIMLNDHTELDTYVQKDILSDLSPLFQEQENDSMEEIIPKARELLGGENGEGLYAMAGRFRLLLRTSDGTEYDSSGNCDSIGYLEWYDRYLTENEISGLGRPENLLYAAVGDFYDADTAETAFTSERFRELMQTYKEVCARHQGSIDQWKVTEEKGVAGQQLAIGPRWYASYSCPQLSKPGIQIEGIPGAVGQNCVLMKLDYPMSILCTSACKEEAFAFILYYSSLEELLTAGDTESAYGKSGSTLASFSVYEEILRKQIYESELPYNTVRTGECFFTEEQINQLKSLIDCAVPDTKVRRGIYSMLMEEMDAYFQGGKDLDSACEILQNRASLYLMERME